jgi:hypothetical protein
MPETMKSTPLLCMLISLLLFTACSDTKKPDNESSDVAKPENDSQGLPLTTEIPEELLEGTPQPIKVANLEPVLNTAPSLIVDKDTRLLSRNKPVTGSDDFPIIGDLSYITDGDKEAGEGYFVELIDGPQWVQIDLGQTARLSAVWIWHYHSQKRAYHDVIVQVSNNADFNDTVITLFNNDYDNTSGQGKGTDQPYVETRFGKLIDARSSEARYVRLWSCGNTSNDMNHYIEVEVFGSAE